MFDWGTKHIGVAIAVPEQKLVMPLKTISASRGSPNKNELKSMVAEYSPSKFVVGFPANMDGTQSPESQKALKFGKFLERQFKVAVDYMDERLTTREAIYRSNQPRPDHSLAALVIGESWLNNSDELSKKEELT